MLQQHDSTAEPRARPWSRREFLARIGASVAGLSAAGPLAACADGPTDTESAAGEIRGTVVDLEGRPQAVGRIFLMYDSGLQTGRYVDVDSEARFRFPNILAGRYQLRFHAPRVAHVPHDHPNPVRVRVEPDRTASATFPIERGMFDEGMIEIYAGDDFFQEQPFGDPNATTVVERGVDVCWYNVGRNRHDVVGEPWGSSGDLGPTDSFIWTADRLGEFDYQCSYHFPQMRATLRVVE